MSAKVSSYLWTLHSPDDIFIDFHIRPFFLYSVILEVNGVVLEFPLFQSFLLRLGADLTYDPGQQFVDDLDWNDSPVALQLVANVRVDPAKGGKASPSRQIQEVIVFGTVVAGHELDRSAVGLNEEGVAQPGAVHPDQDVGVGNQFQLVPHRELVDLDSFDSVMRVTSLQSSQNLILIFDLPLNHSTRIARMSQVVPSPDEENGYLGAVQRPRRVQLEAIENELAKLFEQRRRYLRFVRPLQNAVITLNAPRHV